MDANDFLALPEEGDTIGFVDEDGEPLELMTYVHRLLKSYVGLDGRLLFEVQTQEHEILFVARVDEDEFPFYEWQEVLQ